MGVDTNFDMLAEGQMFPTVDMCVRNAKYRLNESRFDGTYADRAVLVLRDTAGFKRYERWRSLKLNKFKLYTNKMISLMFNRDPIIKTGDASRDKVVNALVDKTGWVSGIIKAVKMMEKLGDAPIKTYSGGVSSFNPINAFKVVSDTNKEEALAYVLVDYIKDDKGVIKNIRFETHFKGYVYERVFEYNGSQLGKPLRFKYKDYIIPVNGAWYDTGVDEFMIQWLKCDGDVYGQSPYEDFADLVHEAERRQTTNIHVLDAHSAPMVAVAMGTLRENEVTGKVEANDVLGNIIEIPNGGMKPEYITWDGKLDSSEKMLDTLFSEIYELTELGRTFMTGEYQGNISDDTLNDLVKSAVDRGNRHVWDIYYEVRKSLYVLCRLNDIDIKIEDINIVFQVGQSDSIKTIADVFNSRVAAGTISRFTGLQIYDGLTEEQAREECDRIIKERGGTQNE